MSSQGITVSFTEHIQLWSRPPACWTTWANSM